MYSAWSTHACKCIYWDLAYFIDLDIHVKKLSVYGITLQGIEYC